MHLRLVNGDEPRKSNLERRIAAVRRQIELLKKDVDAVADDGDDLDEYTLRELSSELTGILDTLWAL